MGVSYRAAASGVAIAMLAPTAAAAPARVDWARGLVIADGLGIADRHAPSPAVARGTSRRAAEDAAKRELAGALANLPLATGGALGAKAGDPAVKARLDRAVDAAFAIAAEPETDGAWNVTLALPIEAVRQAFTGARVVGGAGDEGPAVVVVTGVKAKPAVGWTIGGHSAATIWPAEPPAWAKGAPQVAGTVGAGGQIELAAGSNATDATLFVVIGSPP